jgi:hypothetical protein
MMGTYGLFNYRKSASPDGDPIRAQSESIVQFVSLIKKYTVSGNVDLAGSFSKKDAKGTFDKSAITNVFGSILKNEEGRKELQYILKSSSRTVAKLLQGERKNVLNARVKGRTFALDKTGFQLEIHKSKVSNWDDPEQVADTYYREIENLVKRLTGATRTFCNGHLVRKSGDSDGPLGKLFTAVAGPIQFVHNDFCEDYQDAIIASYKGVGGKATFGIVDQMKKAGVKLEELYNSRLVMVNSWRNISKIPLTRFPLGVCDARTVGMNELCRSSVGGGRGSGMGGEASLDFYSSLYNEGHQWYYYPSMLNTEVLLIKTYDSDLKPFQPTLHSSFDDEATSKDAPERQSCEARILCLIPRKGLQMAKL